MDKKTRTYEEIISLQDKAIEALTQANAALVMALEALKKSRAEHGFVTSLPGLQGLGESDKIGTAVPTNPYVTYVNPTWGYVNPTWGSSSPVWSNSQTANAQSIIANATSRRQLAQDYIAAFQEQTEG